MKNITYRDRFLQMNSVEIEPGKKVSEYDMGSMTFNDFDFGHVEYYRVRSQDVGRPDIISQNIYGTTNFWWFIMHFNGISDIWNDLRENLVLSYPNIEKVREALKACSKEE